MGSEARARLGLIGLIAATLLCFGQLFGTDAYVGPSILAVIFAMGLAILCRRLGASPLVTLAVCGGALLCYLMIVFQAGNTFHGLPTLAALAGLGRSIGRAVETSNIDFAPIPVRPGYVILTVGAMWTLGTLGEVATFRWRRPLIASMGPIALFSFLLVVGSGDIAAFLVVVFIAALLTYWALESSHRLRSWGRWVTPWAAIDGGEAESVTGRVARRMGVTCIAAALVAPVLLPALGTGLLSWRTPTGEGPGGGAGGSGGNIDPLVKLRPQLLNQSSDEFFTVRSTGESYWRLLSLGSFDGDAWRPLSQPDGAVTGGKIGDEPGFDGPTRTITQSFELSGLQGQMLPAAERPDSIDIKDADESNVAVDSESLALALRDGDAKGLSYEVTSVVPEYGFNALRTAQAGIPGDVDDQYFSLPPGLREQLRPVAAQWTEGAEGAFAKLVAIQERFQGGEFAYSEQVETKADENFLVNFLTRDKKGFCQQFATAFALLARDLGYPSRVSVGFLPGNAGDPSTDGTTTYTVRGTHSHAWPEVFFQGYGWVPFEPTPRSDGAARAPDFTRPPTSVSSGPIDGFVGATGNISQGNTPQDPRTGRELGADQSQCAGLRRALRADCRANTGSGAAGGTERRQSYAWQRTFASVARVVLLAGLLWLIAVPLAKELRARRRLRRASGPAAVAAAAFANFLDDASELAVTRSPAESARSYAHRLVVADRVNPAAAERLATLYEAAEYSSTSITTAQAAEAGRLARGLRRSMWKRASWWQRAVRLFGIGRLRPAPRPVTRRVRALRLAHRA